MKYEFPIHYDLVVIGATPGGIACAVRAAREGLQVLLVERTHQLGGMLANGLLQWDALYGGHRAPFFREVLDAIEAHYREKLGAGSADFARVRFSQEHYPLGLVEPHVAKAVFNQLTSREPNLMVWHGWFPRAVQRQGTLLKGVTLRQWDLGHELTVTAQSFADCTYEGDLMALAGAPFRVGREGREEYGEPHAGKLWTQIVEGPASKGAVEGRLNLRPYSHHQGKVSPESSGQGDGAIQAYNLRPIVTCDPLKRVRVEKPANYNRDEFLHYDRRYIPTNTEFDGVSMMNSAILPGENHRYPEADWATRETIYRRHRDFALGLIYFLQNDESVSPSQRACYQKWGLSREEWPENGHVPVEMYVREARRLVGRVILTEADNVIAPGQGRTPIHGDSVGITDWYMDSHACTTESRPGFPYDGKLLLTEESRPAQIPYRCLLAPKLDNLLIPVCLSATHVAWGAVRLEPVWVQVGEAAGWAAALAWRHHTTPGQLYPKLLVKTLCEKRFLVTFFNDVKGCETEDWFPAVQLLGTQGFFEDYDARPHDLLDAATVQQWSVRFTQLTGHPAPELNAGLTRAVACRKMFQWL